MLNNKGYVFLPLVIFLLIIVTLTIMLFKQGLASSVNQASMVQGAMDNAYYNHSKQALSLINDFKLVVYGNLSDSSLVEGFNDSIGGFINSNNPSIPLYLSAESYSKSLVNVSYPEKSVLVTINYPISDLLTAESLFNQLIVQQCLDSNDCTGNRGSFTEIFINCINIQILSFNLRNASVPVLIGDIIYSDLELLNDEMTLLFPFSMGEFLFDC